MLWLEEDSADPCRYSDFMLAISTSSLASKSTRAPLNASVAATIVSKAYSEDSSRFVQQSRDCIDID